MEENYDHPDVLRHTFETLSNLHELLPNHLMELLYSYKSEEDREKCEKNSELSGLERILARHKFPKEINLTPKPSNTPLWKRKAVNNVSHGWKKCYLWNKNTKDPPLSTIVVRYKDSVLSALKVTNTGREFQLMNLPVPEAPTGVIAPLK
uniref:Uncharacterized protein n=1 Tax=Equus asinus asinus TaxID=83772 RepID=A0A8C4M3W2_EQUAS